MAKKELTTEQLLALARELREALFEEAGRDVRLFSRRLELLNRSGVVLPGRDRRV